MSNLYKYIQTINESDDVDLNQGEKYEKLIFLGLKFLSRKPEKELQDIENNLKEILNKEIDNKEIDNKEIKKKLQEFGIKKIGKINLEVKTYKTFIANFNIVKDKILDKILDKIKGGEKADIEKFINCQRYHEAPNEENKKEINIDEDYYKAYKMCLQIKNEIKDINTVDNIGGRSNNPITEYWQKCNIDENKKTSKGKTDIIVNNKYKLSLKMEQASQYASPTYADIYSLIMHGITKLIEEKKEKFLINFINKDNSSIENDETKKILDKLERIFLIDKTHTDEYVTIINASLILDLLIIEKNISPINVIEHSDASSKTALDSLLDKLYEMMISENDIYNIYNIYNNNNSNLSTEDAFNKLKDEKNEKVNFFINQLSRRQLIFDEIIFVCDGNTKNFTFLDNQQPYDNKKFINVFINEKPQNFEIKDNLLEFEVAPATGNEIKVQYISLKTFNHLIKFVMTLKTTKKSGMFSKIKDNNIFVEKLLYFFNDKRIKINKKTNKPIKKKNGFLDKVTNYKNYFKIRTIIRKANIEMEQLFKAEKSFYEKLTDDKNFIDFLINPENSLIIKKEIIKEAITGEHKFGKGNDAVANWILEFNIGQASIKMKDISNESELKKYIDDVLNNCVFDFSFKGSGDKSFLALRLKQIIKPINSSFYEFLDSEIINENIINDIFKKSKEKIEKLSDLFRRKIIKIVMFSKNKAKKILDLFGIKPKIKNAKMPSWIVDKL